MTLGVLDSLRREFPFFLLKISHIRGELSDLGSHIIQGGTKFSVGVFLGLDELCHNILQTSLMWSLIMSHPDSRSEPGSGRETIYWDSLPTLSDIGVSKSYNCINMLYTKIQNKTTTVVVFTVSHTYNPESQLHIQKLYIYIY